MTWIRLLSKLRGDPEVYNLAVALGFDVESEGISGAVGLLGLLWLWCIEQRPEGNLSGVSPEVLARAADWRQKPEVFVDALRHNGFIDEEPTTGEIFVHNWDKYHGTFAANARQRKYREKDKKEEGPEGGGVCGEVGEKGVLKRDSHTNVTPMKMNMNKKEEKSPQSPPATTALDLVFPVRVTKNSSSPRWCVSEDKLEQWVRAHPTLDVPGQIRRAHQWILDNPSAKKTARRMTHFLGGWLARQKPERIVEMGSGRARQTGLDLTAYDPDKD